MLSTLKDWRASAACLAAGLLLWFAWLYPLLPRTRNGWIAAFVFGTVVIVFAALATFLIFWLGERTRFVFLCKVAAVVLALALGAAILAAAYWQQQFLRQDFGYFESR
ncbi:hypothetical protein HHL11_27305 [Ramlibacter sp. G-1-2-2]|uniref:Uncharacterized protein n=1 Tax=Ramlibacter agri TaxID=2728837 RepID=A0A848HIF3_9BURK|nr:hypothetical protein [Ramlibacter agri]